MGTLEDPNEANGPLNMRIPEDIMKGQVQTSSNEHRYDNPMPHENNFIPIM